jgi:hypothetical protein
LPITNVTQANNAATTAATLAEQLVLSAQTGTAVTTQQITQSLVVVASAISRAAEAGGENNAQINAQAAQSVSNAADLLNTFVNNSVVLSESDRTRIRAATVALLNTTAEVARNTSDTVQILDLVQQQNDITVANTALGIQPTPEQITATAAASLEIATKVAEQALSSLGSNLTVDNIRTALAADPQILSRVVDAALLVPPSIVRSQAEQQANALSSAGQNPPVGLVARLQQANAISSDVSATSIGGLSAAEAISLLFGGANAIQAFSVTMVDANGRIANVSQAQANSVSVRVDSITNQVTISLPGETYVGTVAGVRAVPASVPTGVRFNADGSALIINRGFAIEIAPAPIDLVKFVNAVERAGFPFRMSSNGLITLQVGSGERFSGAFAYDNLTGRDLSTCGALSFTEPTGALNSAGYAFGVRCANGASQRVVPFIESASFEDSVRAFGLTPSTDRNTGFVTIPTVGVFKPNFFVLQRTPAEQAFYTANKDSFGNAVQYLDANGDGKLDVRLITATGTQLLFGR